MKEELALFRKTIPFLQLIPNDIYTQFSTGEFFLPVGVLSKKHEDNWSTYLKDML